MSKIKDWLIGKNVRAMFGAIALLIGILSFYLYNLVDKLFSIGFAVAALVLVFGIYLHNRLSKIALLNRLRKQWGNPLKINRDLKKIKDAYKTMQLSDQECYQLDDQTWNDLHMDDIYSLADRTHTSCGQVLLYNILRKPITKSDKWEKRKKAIYAFHENVDFREKLQMILHKLGRQDKEQVEILLTSALPTLPKLWILLEILPYLGLASIIASYVLFSLGEINLFVVPLFITVILSTVNGIIRHRLKKGILPYFTSIGYLGKIINTAKHIKELHTSGLERQLEGLSKAYDKCKIINNKTYALSLEQVDPFGLYSYINVLFLIDIRMFFRVIKDINKYRDELITLYTTIGELDALISIASFRDSHPFLSEPELHSQGIRYEVENMVHPMISDPVANSISLAEKGALITGSNMSGKSTFLRSVAVNTVLAQTICGTFTSKYIASFFKVTTSISQSDNLAGGKSYYLAEAETLLNMINGVQSDIPSLCIIDEIFRGTNSKERIAAASQLLKYMSKLNALTIVATHDIELTGMAKAEYDIYYFDENVGAEGLIFDYNLKRGVSPTTNAIKILDYLGYPKEIVNSSNALINSTLG